LMNTLAPDRNLLIYEGSKETYRASILLVVFVIPIRASSF